VAKFTDAKGREWSLVITIGHVAELRRDAGFDFDKLKESEDAFASALFGNPITIAKILWVLVRKGGATTEDEFYDGLDPDSVDRATVALMEAIVDFFHRGRSSPARNRVKEVMERAGKVYEEGLEKAVTTALKRLSGDLPESSASIPAR
jgi:hypothetical protein